MSTAGDSRADVTDPQAGFDGMHTVVTTAQNMEAVRRRYQLWDQEYPEETEDAEKKTCDDTQRDPELPPYSPPAEDPNITVTVTEVSWDSSESPSHQESPVGSLIGSLEDNGASPVASAIQIVEQSVTSRAPAVNTRPTINAIDPVSTYPLTVDAITVEESRGSVHEGNDENGERKECYETGKTLSHSS